MCQKHSIILSNFHILHPLDSFHDHLSDLGISTYDSDILYREAGNTMAQTPDEGPGHRS